MLPAGDIPNTPQYSSRPSRSGLSFYRDMLRQTEYAVFVSLGPHAFEYATNSDGHRYLATDVGDIDGAPHLDYLTPQACEKLLARFFNPALGTDTSDTDQQSLDEF
jgi:hypothetical protein